MSEQKAIDFGTQALTIAATEMKGVEQEEENKKVDQVGSKNDSNLKSSDLFKKRK